MPEPEPTPSPITQQLGSGIERLQEVRETTKELFDFGKELITPSSVGVAAGLGGVGWGLAGGLLIGMIIGGVVVWFLLTQTNNNNNNNNGNNNGNKKNNALLTNLRLPF